MQSPALLQLQSRFGGAIAMVARCGSTVSCVRQCVATDFVTRSSRGSDRRFFSCSWQHLLAKKVAKLRFGSVQQTENRSARPRRQLRDLFGRVSLHDGQKQRLAFFRPQRTEGTAELAVLQNVGPIPIQNGVIAFTSLPFVIEREEKDLTIPSTAIDEPVSNCRKQIGQLPRSVGRQNRQARVLNEIVGFDRIVRKRKGVTVAAFEQRIDAVGHFMVSSYRFGRPHVTSNNERERQLIALSRLPTACLLREVPIPAA